MTYFRFPGKLQLVQEPPKKRPVNKATNQQDSIQSPCCWPHFRRDGNGVNVNQSDLDNDQNDILSCSVFEFPAHQPIRFQTRIIRGKVGTGTIGIIFNGLFDHGTICIWGSFNHNMFRPFALSELLVQLYFCRSALLLTFSTVLVFVPDWGTIFKGLAGIELLRI